jgi:hypothetical protein
MREIRLVLVKLTQLLMISRSMEQSAATDEMITQNTFSHFPHLPGLSST